MIGGESEVPIVMCREVMTLLDTDGFHNSAVPTSSVHLVKLVKPGETSRGFPVEVAIISG